MVGECVLFLFMSCVKNLKRTSEALASGLVILHGSTKIWNPVSGNGIRNP